MWIFVRSTLMLPIITLLCVPPEACAETVDKTTPRATACTACGFEAETAGLEKLLSHYQAVADKGGWPVWRQGKKMTPGQQDPRVPSLRRLLTVTGDYQADQAIIAGPAFYDDTLVAALKRFQERHGLNPDGVLGKATQEALAVPVEQRLLQITATLARIRQRTQQASEPKFILVNLPAFSLYAVARGQPTLSMRVIIGNRKNPTPLFDNAVPDVIFNPQWHVPERIAEKEMIPKLREDPGYFIKSGFVVTQDGEPIDPAHLAPESLAAGGNDFTFLQLAGDSNALGKIKFNIPDAEDIYLHSTASPRLFAKDDRALSHGCIRVENPRALAYFVFAGNADWDQNRIDRAYDSDKKRWVKVEAVPVHLVYWDAFVDADGIAHFYPDVYGKDADAQ